LETSSSSKNPKNIVSNLDTYSNNAKADALGDLASYRKKYTIAEDVLFGPVPNQECYGEVSVANAAEVLSVIQRARDSGLLGADEAVAFDPNVEFYNDGSNIRYYYDETILVILWKEMINGRICSNAEVKIADASQFRRKLADDTYQTAVQYNCSQLASSANAVVAMNADFFAFRDYGITVYQRTVYRDNPNMVDTCYITKSGDMIYSLKGELPSMEAAQQFVDENNVLFSLAFGPILIYDGVTQYCETYPMGEIDKEYSRAGIGQLDERHYLYMTVNHAVEGGVPRCNVNEFAEIFATQNVKTAYNLDGGQTSEINICGDMYNRVDWGNERPVSDIIYFATAIDETEVG
jgi:Exopolysaccharide biosynthesis protein related to N-acetylglucosamine-1-phosphodiester alpha-N-acetylglucosaminidase